MMNKEKSNFSNLRYFQVDRVYALFVLVDGDKIAVAQEASQRSIEYETENLKKAIPDTRSTAHTGRTL